VLSDARELARDQQVDAKIWILEAWLARTYVARELIRNGASVWLPECGGREVERRAQRLNLSSLGDPIPFRDRSQVRALGVTSTPWLCPGGETWVVRPAGLGRLLGLSQHPLFRMAFRPHPPEFRIRPRLRPVPAGTVRPQPGPLIRSARTPPSPLPAVPRSGCRREGSTRRWAPRRSAASSSCWVSRTLRCWTATSSIPAPPRSTSTAPRGSLTPTAKCRVSETSIVAGSSVFQACGYNSALTVVALALRLAEHVKKQLPA
jgi:hypothetical protein